MNKRLWIALLLGMALALGFTLTGCGSGSEEADQNTEEQTTEVVAVEEEDIKVDDPVKVECDNGVMLGATKDGVTFFKGVPYAKPPVGDLRWKAPEAPEESDDEIECYKYGYTALQYEWPTEPASSYEKSEDCLTLNIWETEGTEDGDEAKPVMVFFHGGAYGWGGTTDPTYDGQNFIKDNGDVILVTCNYRLGLMGWADFSEIEGGEEYTDVNLGIRDHIAALEWIQENIKGFGGDPDNVTIFGESAGAFSTTALAVSPAAEGLFKRIIAESGIINIRDRREAKEFGAFIAKAAGAKDMDDLLAITGDEWMDLDYDNEIADNNCGIVADGEIIPEASDLDRQIQKAADQGIEVLLGTNNDEWNYFLEDMFGETEEEKFAAWVEGMDTVYDEVYKNTDDEGKAALKELLKYEEEQVPKEYAKDKKVKAALAKSAFMTETWRYQHIDFADKYAEAGGDVYMYLWKIPSTKDEMFKSAVHAIELAYVFNNAEETTIYAGKVDKASAKRTQESWTNYAKTGDPSIEEAKWDKYDAKERMTMVIDKDKWECVSDPSKTARQYMTKVYKDVPYSLW